MTKHNLNQASIFSVSGCLTENALVLYTQNQLSAAQRVEVEEHTSTCEMCKDSLEGYAFWMKQHADPKTMKTGPEKLKVSPAAFASRTELIRERIRQRVNFHKQVAAVKNQRKMKKPYSWMATAATVILFLAVFYIVRVQNIFDKNKLAESTQNKNITIPDSVVKIEASTEKPAEIAQQFSNSKPQRKRTVAESKEQEALSIVENDINLVDDSKIVGPLVANTATEKSNSYPIGTEETISPQVPASAEEEAIVLLEYKVKTVQAEAVKKETAEDEVVNYIEGVRIASKTSPSQKSDEVFMIVEQMPQFPGGEESLKKFLSENIQYPQLAKENGIEGTVVVSFVVLKNGKLTDIKAIKSLGGGCDEQAIAAVKAMPRWIPGVHSGHKVDVRFNLPIVFKIK